MDALQSIEPSAKGAKSVPPKTKAEATHIETPTEEVLEPTPLALLAKAAEAQSSMREKCRRDSVISDAAEPASEINGAVARATSLGQSLNLGSSILKTPSVASSSKSPATLLQHEVLKFDVPIVNTPSATASSKPSSPPPPKTAGSTWLMKYDGKFWPIVLCDVNTAPPKFVETRHAASHLPAVLLGKRIYIWAISKDLTPYLWECDYLAGAKRFDTDDVLPTDSKEDGNEKLRQRAFRTDASMNQGHDFWMNVIEQRQGEREASRMRSQKGHKRPRQHLTESDAHYARRKRFHFEQIKQQQKSLGYKPHKSREKRSWLGNDRTSSDDDEDSHSAFKKRKRSSDDRAFDRAKEERQAVEMQKRIKANYLKDFEQKKGICTISVGTGENKQSFDIANSYLSQCVVLSGLLKRPAGHEQQTEDSYINLPEAFDIKPEEFGIVESFLVKGSFPPHVVKGSNGRPVIEGVRTASDADAASRLLAQGYRTASRLQLESLQQRCVEKLRFLPDIGPSALIFVMKRFADAELYGCRAAIDMEQWLVDRSGAWEAFLSLMKEDPEALGEVLEGQTHFRMSVFERMAGIEREQTKQAVRKGERDEGSEYEDSESE